MNYVIIGNSTAAIGAVEGIRGIDKGNPVTIISDEPYHTYSRPLISYFLAGKITEDKMLYRPKEFYVDNKVRLMLGKKAVALDIPGCRVLLEDGDAVAYDRLLLATGGKPFIPRIKGQGKENIFTFCCWEDVRRIKERIHKNTKAVVVGGGLTGLKAAESLRMVDVDVTVVELADRVLSTILDEQAAALIHKILEEHEIKYRLGTTVSEILGDEKVSGVILQDGTQLDCDMLIFAIGINPNIDLVKNTSVETNRGIVVDRHMRTSVDGIYAAGDVAEGYDLLFKQHRVLATLPNAYKQGETAGMNMAGVPVAYAGGFAFNAISFFGFPIITAGVQSAQGDIEEVIEMDGAGDGAGDAAGYAAGDGAGDGAGNAARDAAGYAAGDGAGDVAVDVAGYAARDAAVSAATGTYRKILLKDDNVIGFIFLNEVDRAGILTGMIRDSLNVGEFKDRIAGMEFGYACFPKQLRKERLFGSI